MASRNFLLGQGERLTSTVVVRSGGPDKAAPYTFGESRKRLAPQLRDAASAFLNLPSAACPDGLVVAALTINPEYIAKSYYPGRLLSEVGLVAIGSKPVRITPAKRSRDRDPEPSLTTELFVAGRREAFARWADFLPEWTEFNPAAADLATIETVAAPAASDKIKGKLPAGPRAVFEVVLHAGAHDGEDAVRAFSHYMSALDVDAPFARRFDVGGLCFLEMEAPVSQAQAIATYTMVRALRRMPELRVLRPAIRSANLPAADVALPTAGPVDPQTTAALFDGGLPLDHALTAWVTPIEPDGIGPSLPVYVEHGTSVTSALLFGHIDPDVELPRPYCRVDHYRVLDTAPGQNPHELYEVLQRIRAVLDRRTYPFINFSLGPSLPIEDDDVSAWTAVLDEYLSRSDTLATVAVGNAGDHADPAACRIQAPSDCVNALAVGACDRPDAGWARAPYSCVGPGRSPGLIKPDLVAFGGSLPRPFIVVGPGPGMSLQPTGGTSFAAPSVLRLGAGIRAHFGPSLNLLAIRALVVHGCERSGLPLAEVGRGRVPLDLEALVLCEDDEMRVVYQGEIGSGKFIRAPIPMPAEALSGMVSVSATLCFTTSTDPHHPGNYTQAGVEATFRPHDDARSRMDQIHADTRSFFGQARKGLTEEELRRDAWKWENTHHATLRMRGASLRGPVFDLHYNARDAGHALSTSETLRYALVVTLKAPKTVDLYDRVRRRYATQLQPFLPVIEIPIRT